MSHLFGGRTLTQQDPMPSFYNLEAAKLYGLPVEIDGVALTERQACRVIPILIEKAMGQAKHDLDTAKGMAVAAFRRMYGRTEDGWIARRFITTSKNHGGVFRNKFWCEEDERMGRVRATEAGWSPAKRLLESAKHESGARNSTKDKKAIKEVIRLALGQLSKEDGAKTLGDLRLKIKEE